MIDFKPCRAEHCQIVAVHPEHVKPDYKRDRIVVRYARTIAQHRRQVAK